MKWKYNTGYITEIVIPNIDLQGRLYITNNPQGELIAINPDGTLNWKVKYDTGFLQNSPFFRRMVIQYIYMVAMLICTH